MFKIVCIIFPLLFLQATPCLSQKQIVIAHRGASGYLPEHNLSSASLAFGMGADFIEPDVVLTKDSIPIILHDIYLDLTTNISEVFPKRNRTDNHWYAIDFTLKEIKSLKLRERTYKGSKAAVFKNRSDVAKDFFTIPTLEEFILLIENLNKTTGKKVGIYPEIKKPSFHLAASKDITKIVLSKLVDMGYPKKSTPIYLQCFDMKELQKAKKEWSQFPLIQLIGDNRDKEAQTDYNALQTTAGILKMKTYAVGVGPSIHHLITNTGNGPTETTFSKLLKKHRLLIHPYTVRKDSLPSWARSIHHLHEILFNKIKVDGVFTDFTDLTVSFLNKKQK